MLILSMNTSRAPARLKMRNPGTRSLFTSAKEEAGEMQSQKLGMGSQSSESAQRSNQEVPLLLSAERQFKVTGFKSAEFREE